jgi:choline dehydrogenase
MTYRRRGGKRPARGDIGAVHSKGNLQGNESIGSDDPHGVVNARLRVRGVVALRVVDCSIMPTTVSGNTNAPAMAVAWRAADLILQDAAR